MVWVKAVTLPCIFATFPLGEIIYPAQSRPRKAPVRFAPSAGRIDTVPGSRGHAWKGEVCRVALPRWHQHSTPRATPHHSALAALNQVPITATETLRTLPRGSG